MLKTLSIASFLLMVAALVGLLTSRSLFSPSPAVIAAISARYPGTLGPIVFTTGGRGLPSWSK
jgi:hypothetical protein